jgi:parvulin-like peptidyl-prolyl isomerase
LNILSRGAVAAFVACAIPVAASAFEVDGIAARVGTETILKSDVFLEMGRLRAPKSDYAKVRNEMIDRKLILRAAGAAKMTMQDWVVESRIREIVEKAFDGDRNKLMDTLARQKVSYPEWHARMKEDMVVSAMRWSVIEKNAAATPSAMRKEFAENPDRYRVGANVTVSVILLKPEDMSKRDDVAAMIRTNDFAAAAKAFSADSQASEGGVWKNVVPSEVFKPEVCEEISKMPRGTMSHWIELDGWSFLVRKDAEDRGRLPTFLEAYDEIEANVKEAASKAAYDAWLERLRSETYIKVY